MLSNSFRELNEHPMKIEVNTAYQTDHIRVSRAEKYFTYKYIRAFMCIYGA